MRLPRINRAEYEKLSPEERRDFDSLLAELERIYRENPLQAFEPHAKQVEFLRSRDRVKAFLGGNRSGKTTCGIVDDLVQAVDGECLPEHLRQFKRWEPPFKCRLVAPDFTETMKTTVFEKIRELVPASQLRGGSWESAYKDVDRKLYFANGSVFSFMTFEQDIDKFGGAALHRVHYDEEPPENIRKECRKRLLDYEGDELFTMTPLMGMTWMFDGVYERRHEDGVTVVQVSTTENPHLSRQAIEDYFADLSETELAAVLHGRFVHFGGLVLGDFDDARHVVDPIERDHLEGQDVYIGIDPGVARGGVVWVAVDRENRMLVFDELYPRNQDVGPHDRPGTIAYEIFDKNAYWGIEDPLYVIDPSARNRLMTSGAGGENVESEFYRCGIFPMRGQNLRRAGVMQLRRRLGADPPALLVTRNCSRWLWECGRWRVHQDEETAQEKPRGDQTGDSFKTIGADHLMDPTRYIAMARSWGPHLVEPARKSHGWTPGEALSFEQLQRAAVDSQPQLI